ncbi:hypothetical protein LCGC14_1677400, partial [marine sediment metagenome]
TDPVAAPAWPNRIVGHGEEAPDQLLANPRNWRIHPKAQQDALAGVMDQVGWVQEITVNRVTGFVVDGHLRVAMAISREEPMVPVRYVDLSEEEEALVLATLDPLAGMAATAKDALEALLADVQPGSDAVTALLEDVARGAGLNGAKEGLTDPDAVPEAEPVAKRGDVWVCGDHRVMCGDSTDEEDVAGLMAGEKAVLCLTDPPYGINIVRGLSATDGAKPFGRVRQPGGRPSGVLKGKVGGPGVVEPRLYAPVHGDDKPFDPTPLLGLAANHIVFGGIYFNHKLPQGTAWICWDKGVSDEATFSAFELAWTSYEGRHRMYRHTWSGMVRAGPRAEELKDRVHPTQKPVGLFAALLTDFTQSGAVIIDPFLGSGTTMIAAERLGRRCYGMEIEPRYVDVAVRRWEDFTGRKAELLHKTKAVSA